MTMICGRHAEGKVMVDKIFAANGACQEAIAKYGKDKVVNATLGAIYDEDEKLVCLSTVEKVFQAIPMREKVAYAPISGLPDYLEKVQDAAFGKYKPNVFTAAVATPGGTGSLHNVVWNYMDPGDVALCGDWFWGTYKVMCKDMCRDFMTFKMFDDNLQFNFADLEAKIKTILAKQDRMVFFLNTPGHNPTGFSINEGDFAKVLNILKTQSAAFNKPITLVLDVAYIDFAGDKDEVRKMFKVLETLPKNIFTIVCYSMSKGYTMYGQRCGAMIGVSCDKEVIDEFKEINKFTSRSSWSNCNRACMQTLVNIEKDLALKKELEDERKKYFDMIRARADIFTAEAKECGLKMIPYVAGFFMSIPAKDSDAICDELKKDKIFCVPLAAGVRVAVCGTPLPKVKGLAKKIKAAMDAVGE